MSEFTTKNVNLLYCDSRAYFFIYLLCFPPKRNKIFEQKKVPKLMFSSPISDNIGVAESKIANEQIVFEINE